MRSALQALFPGTPPPAKPDGTGSRKDDRWRWAKRTAPSAAGAGERHTGCRGVRPTFLGRPRLILWRLVVVLAGLAIGGGMTMAEDKPIAVSVVTARSGELADLVRVTGSLVAREESLVKVDLADTRIISVEAEAGDMVRQGDVLARLDPTLITIEQKANAVRLARAAAAVAQAQSQIEDAQLAHEQARADRERSGKLRAKGFAAEETLETRQTALMRAASALALARQSLTVAEADRRIIVADGQEIAARLARTVIAAPTGGRILRRSAKVGAMTAAGGDPLFVIAVDGEIELDAEMPEVDFARLAVGQTASIAILGKEAPIEGRVRLLAPELEGRSRLGRARIALSPAGGLSVGAFARGDVEVERRGGVLLPTSAVIARDGGTSVHLVEDGVVLLRPIATGLRAAGLVEISAGVSPGDIVVLKAGNFLVPGDRVSPLDVTYPARMPADHPFLTSDAAR
ncbi:efflux RND transporter periplasmic adaptor subunit [Aureimonas glaciei]|uniref:Hemolysin secretion protein D n=1 Tax=Aureimonas glaciei TaxID=1776957 RepID=A0A916Y888_9HYPH|nr:efflux RND transporter periplasmic adaptor subunit [Aureimonas glaciei]GGD34394.1 hemolysin secretion protein D [Aureimonas glaciei]